MGIPAGSTGDERHDMEGRQLLVDQRLPDLVAAHDHALAEGMRQPVVFLVDCEDPLGSQIARQWAGDDAVDAAILATATESDSDSAEETSTTTLVQAFPFEECRREVPPLFPYLAGSFQRPPADGFLIVVISYGGAATFTAPTDGER